MAKCKKLKTPVKSKKGGMRRCKRMSKRMSKKSKRMSSKRSCSRGMKKHTRVCKRKPGRKRMSRKKSSKKSKKSSKKSKKSSKKSVLSKAAKALQRRCNNRANYECYGDPNCTLTVSKGKRGHKRVKCVPRSRGTIRPMMRQGPINMPISKRMLL